MSYPFTVEGLLTELFLTKYDGSNGNGRLPTVMPGYFQKSSKYI